jgi:hypothetical protein
VGLQRLTTAGLMLQIFLNVMRSAYRRESGRDGPRLGECAPKLLNTAAWILEVKLLNL